MNAPARLQRRAGRCHHQTTLRVSGTAPNGCSPRASKKMLRALEKECGTPACAGWTVSLRASDSVTLWRQLHRLVRSHPLVRNSSATAVAGWATPDSHEDLTQDLFVTLLGKDRFRHYLDAGMSDREIETEIGRIELTNLLTARLRKRYPESYRLARRVSGLLQTSPRFRRFDDAGRGRPIRLTEQVYGLSRWPAGMPTRPAPESARRVAAIPVRWRDLRVAGCTGDTQVVIGNTELEGLIVEVLEAVDAPADVRAIRALVMSRLPIWDASLTQFRVAGEDGCGGRRVFEPVDTKPTPEQEALRHDREGRINGRVDEFLVRLRREVRGKTKQYGRILSVLWHYYLSDEHPTQLRVAALLGVSDTLVSNYRQRIERALCSLSLTSVAEACLFEEALTARMQAGDVSGATRAGISAPATHLQAQ